MKNFIHWSARILLAAAYISSGLLKLYPVEFFENDLLYHHLANETLAPFVARWLIGSELIVGGAILFFLWDRVFLTMSFIMLTIYTVYLTIVLGLEGNGGNCGCMGHDFVLTPLEGILKNVVLFALTFIVWKGQCIMTWKFRKPAIILVTLAGISMPFILNKVFFPRQLQTTTGNRTILPLEKLNEGNDFVPFQLDTGKQIVAFLLMECSHCKLTASRLEIIKRSHPELPMHLIILGEKEDLPHFIEETKIEEIPFVTYHSLHRLIKVSGPDFPSVYLLKYSVVESELGFYDINADHIIEWYKSH